MSTVLKSLLAGAAIAIFSPIPILIAYILWASFVSPGFVRQGGGEVGWDLITIFHNSPWLWYVLGAIFVFATASMYLYFSRRRA
jgi:hypothetical protein